MDTELFELCQQVYEKTQWETGEWIDYYEGKFTIYKAKHNNFNSYVCPVYTSDYLLEKLPKTIWSTYGLCIYPGEHVTSGGYIDPDGLVGVEINELQKCPNLITFLLKLTLALADTNQLEKGTE